jgi:hypothetical protein
MQTDIQHQNISSKLMPQLPRSWSTCAVKTHLGGEMAMLVITNIHSIVLQTCDAHRHTRTNSLVAIYGRVEQAAARSTRLPLAFGQRNQTPKPN